MADRPLRVLFLCTGNSCRSQMAEGWARRLWPGQIEAHSAGTAPAGINPLAARVMAESGVNLVGQSSKGVAAVRGLAFDFVVTLCDSARESCPVGSFDAPTLHAGFDDPPSLAAGANSDEEALPHYRRVRDEIRDFIQTLPEQLARPWAPNE